MTNPAFNPEDPRLTAFVLGEIDDSDRAGIEQLLESSPAAQAAVQEIEETIGVLKEGLASEPVPELTAEQRSTVEEQLAGGVTATASSMPVTDDSVDRTHRAGTRFGKLAGVVASVCALGLLVTFVLPPFQNSDNFLVDSTLRVSDDLDEFAAMSSAPESETSVAYDVTVSDMSGLSNTEERPPADGWGKVEEATESIVARVSSSRPAGNSAGGYPATPRSPSNGFPGASSSRVSGIASADRGRSESDFSKHDSSRLVRATPAEKTADFDRLSPGKESKPVKDSNGSPLTQRLVADAGSPPQSASSRQEKHSGGIAAPQTTRPMAERGSVAKNESLVSGFEVASADSSRSVGVSPKSSGSLPPAPVSGKRAADKVSLASQLAGAAGGKSVNGPRVDAPRVSGRGVGNSVPAKPQSAVGGVVASSPEPANSVALLPGQDRAKKRVLFHEEQRSSVAKQKVAAFAPATEAEVLRQIRQREQALAPQEITEGLAELAKQPQTQLAAIDSGATRRGGARGFGLEGRDLQEQLQRYRQRVAPNSEARTTEAKRQSFGFGAETYEAIVENDFIIPVVGDKEKSLSTISVDVDTASYANMRRFLSRDQLPPANSVRIEELLNYFKYDYPEPEGNDPFSVKTELASCPWQPSHRLAMVGLKARTIDKAQRPPTNLIFLLDVSGSMRASNKLPLVQQSMRLLVEEMTEDDRVSIVTYASNAGVRLESTLGSKKQEILAAINGLRAGGSTNGEGGIRMAYDEANRHYFQGGANRVILCSDGDFNVGRSSDGELVELIQEKAASGVFLSVFGFGMGNLKDAKLEKLADKGNGHYGYIDNLNEARKVFQDELVGTLYTVAKDVKLQVEFNPATVGAYRLIGYENRKLSAQDFTDDTKDAGEIGSGHTVTALYEIIPKHVLLTEPSVDGLKYQATAKKPVDEGAKETAGDAPAAESVDPVEIQSVDEELLTVKLRYKKPDEEVSQPVEQEYAVKDVQIAGKQISAVSDDLMFAASVASFGMNLRGSKYRGNWGFAEALETAQGAQGDGNNAQRTEFIQLVQRAMRITGQQTGPQPRTTPGTTTRPGELAAAEARIKAAVNGKYRRLVKKIEVRDDFQRFGAFNDYGHWDGTEYAGHKDLPPGNWVYVYPNWYIWAEAVVPAKEAVPATEEKVGQALPDEVR